MDIILRLEEEKNYYDVENLTREAFWGLSMNNIERTLQPGAPGCSAHYLVHKLRQIEEFVPELDYLAFQGDTLVGSICFIKGCVLDENEAEHEILNMGNLSVLPGFQKLGVGSMLMRHAMAKAMRRGYKGIVLFGEPEFYSKFNFRPASDFGITTSDGKNFDSFLAVALSPGSLKDISGRCIMSDVFEIDEAELIEFDKSFPPKASPINNL